MSLFAKFSLNLVSLMLVSAGTSAFASDGETCFLNQFEAYFQTARESGYSVRREDTHWVDFKALKAARVPLSRKLAARTEEDALLSEELADETDPAVIDVLRRELNAIRSEMKELGERLDQNPRARGLAIAPRTVELSNAQITAMKQKGLVSKVALSEETPTQHAGLFHSRDKKVEIFSNAPDLGGVVKHELTHGRIFARPEAGWRDRGGALRGHPFRFQISTLLEPAERKSRNVYDHFQHASEVPAFRSEALEVLKRSPEKKALIVQKLSYSNEAIERNLRGLETAQAAMRKFGLKRFQTVTSLDDGGKEVLYRLPCGIDSRKSTHVLEFVVTLRAGEAIPTRGEILSLMESFGRTNRLLQRANLRNLEQLN